MSLIQDPWKFFDQLFIVLWCVVDRLESKIFLNLVEAFPSEVSSYSGTANLEKWGYIKVIRSLQELEGFF